MRRFLVLAAALAACGALAGCNPPAKQQVAAPCNCQGNVTPSNPVAENQRFVPPGGGEEQQYTGTHRHRSAHRYTHDYASGYGEHYGYHSGYRHRSRHSFHHGYQGSDEDYARYWSSMRVAVSSYDYRSTSRVHRSSGTSSGYVSGGAYSSGDYVGEPAHYESGWEDGYGRTHGGTHLSRGAYAARMDPWHGYDVDCPDGDHHHHGYHHRY